MNIKPIKNTVLFQFRDAINTRNEFERGQTESGLIIAGDTFDASAKESRWGRVIGVGPDVTSIKVGDDILLPALRWTEAIKHEGQKFWKTDESEVVATLGNGDGAQPKPRANWVLFKQNKQGRVRNTGLLLVVGGVDETPSGTAFAVGPDCEPELKGSTLFYNADNFTDTTKNAGVEFAFIKDSDILAYQIGE